MARDCNRPQFCHQARNNSEPARKGVVAIDRVLSPGPRRQPGLPPPARSLGLMEHSDTRCDVHQLCSPVTRTGRGIHN